MAISRLLAFGEFIGDRGGCEDFGQEVGQLSPFFVLAAAPDRERQRLKALERGDFGFEFGDSARRRRLIEDRPLGLLDFVFGRILKSSTSSSSRTGDAVTDSGRVTVPPRCSSSSSRSRLSKRSRRRRSDW
jgi:hypothetical protein